MTSAPGSKCGSYTVLTVEVFFLLIVGLTPFVDNYAHLGGLLGGVFTSMAAIEKIDYEGFFGKEKEGGDRFAKRQERCDGTMTTAHGK